MNISKCEEKDKRSFAYSLLGKVGIDKPHDCTAHFIRTMVLEKLVLADIRRVSAYVRDYEDDFVQMVIDKTMTRAKTELTAKKKELEKFKRRINELDALFKRLYEDIYSKGRLSKPSFITFQPVHLRQFETVIRERRQIKAHNGSQPEIIFQNR